MNAKEARKRADEVNALKFTNQLKEVLEGIEDCTEVGEYEYEYIHYNNSQILTTSVKNELINKQFIIIEKPEENKYIIQW